MLAPLRNAARVIIALCISAGCTSVYSPTAIATDEWASFRVVYLYRDMNGIHVDYWATTDAIVLANLRRRFPTGPFNVSFSRHGSRINRMDILLRNGCGWEVSYFPYAGALSVNSYSHEKGSFSVNNVAPTFFDYLRDIIQEEKGVNLDYDLNLTAEEWTSYRGADASGFLRGVLSPR